MEQKNLFGDPEVVEEADKTFRDNLHKVFDSVAGEQLKREGISYAELHRGELLMLAKVIARNFAESCGYLCTADDFQRGLIARGHNPSDLGNAAGSVFRGPEWEFTGRWVPSQRVSNHRRYLRVWRLKNRGEKNE